jgi:hypothetical protein
MYTGENRPWIAKESRNETHILMRLAEQSCESVTIFRESKKKLDNFFSFSQGSQCKIALTAISFAL